MTDHIIVEQPSAYPGVQSIRFNRPEKKNDITRAMYRTMADALNAANTSPDIRA
ncbi:enoyl-CoA hydratase, partial [Rhizobium leguminosarum]